MTIRVLLTSGAIAAALLISACHKEEAAANEANAAELSNMGDTNANDATMNEDAGNVATNAQ